MEGKDIKALEDKINSLAAEIFALGEKILEPDDKAGKGIYKFVGEEKSKCYKKYTKLFYIVHEWRNYNFKKLSNYNLLLCLNKCIYEHNPGYELPFVNYLSNQLKYALLNEKKSIREDIRQGMTHTLDEKTIQKILSIKKKYGCIITDPRIEEDLIKNFGYTEEKARKVLSDYQMSSVVSLNTPVGENNGELGDFVKDPASLESSYIKDEEKKADKIEFREMLFSSIENFYLEQGTASKKNKSIIYSYPILNVLRELDDSTLEQVFKKYKFLEHSKAVVDYYRKTKDEPSQKEYAIQAGIPETKFSLYLPELIEELRENKELLRKGISL